MPLVNQLRGVRLMDSILRHPSNLYSFGQSNEIVEGEGRFGGYVDERG